MERIDELESTVLNLQRCLQEVAAGRQVRDECSGAAQNLKTGKSSNSSETRPVIVDHDLKLVVLHIPKCAGTALQSLSRGWR